MIFASLPTAQRVLRKPGELSLIEVSALCQGCPIDDIVAQLSAALPEAKVSALQQAVRARLQTVERLSRFSTALSVVMLLIGFVIVFITMMNSVVERTREVGVLRALGFRKSHIVRIFIICSSKNRVFFMAPSLDPGEPSSQESAGPKIAWQVRRSCSDCAVPRCTTRLRRSRRRTWC